MRKIILNRLIASLIMIAPVVMCTACAGGSSGDESLDKVLEAKKLVIGLDDNFPPMGYVDESGEVVGFDIDVAKETCKRLGIELVPKTIEWEDKDDLLNKGEIDCIWNGMSVNDERRETMSLSEPYMKNNLVFVVSKNSGIKSSDELKGKKIALQDGTTGADELMKSDMNSDVETVMFNDSVKMLEYLEEGKVDAVLTDSVFVYYYIAENNKEFYVLPNELKTEKFTIGFRKNDEALRDKIQEVLHEMKVDGTLADISTKWFETDITTVR